MILYQKLKKQNGMVPTFDLSETEDILASVSKLKKNRPKMVIGFAAETENLDKNSFEQNENLNYKLNNNNIFNFY